MKWAWLVLLAACGDNLAAPALDAASCGDGSCVAACSAVFSGNTLESSSSPDQCPMLQPGAGDSMDHTMLNILVPSAALGTTLGIQIDLGPAPIAGDYSSATTAPWSAIAIKSVPVHGGCVFSAGSAAIPSGSFVMHLDAVDPVALTVRGSLGVQMFILPRTTEQGMPTDCGAGTTETVELTF